MSLKGKVILIFVIKFVHREMFIVSLYHSFDIHEIGSNDSFFIYDISNLCLVFFFPFIKAMAPHSSTVAQKIPWMEESGRLQSMGSLRVGHN